MEPESLVSGADPDPDLHQNVTDPQHTGLQFLSWSCSSSVFSGSTFMFRLAISLGGDTDTIASMAGAITGAYLGIQVSADLLFTLFTVSIVPGCRYMGKICVRMFMLRIRVSFMVTMIQCPSSVVQFMYRVMSGKFA